MNNFIRFYEQHKISPVSQDISDFGLHVARREGLYRTLGLPALAFARKDVLEVGPGSGYNSIVTAAFGPRSYVLVEPNSTGFARMNELFKEYGGPPAGVETRCCTLEDMGDDKTFDIVLCEGMMAGIENQEEVLQLLDARVRPGGAIVLTGFDAISYFFENCRRYLGRIITADVPDFDAKVELLRRCFEPHVATLRGRTRPVRDWVIDNLLNPAAADARHLFSMEDCLRRFEKTYYFHGSSPDMFNDFTWYKELEPEPAAFNAPFIQQARERAHALLDYRTRPERRDACANDALRALCHRVATIDHEFDRRGDDRQAMLAALCAIADNVDFSAQTRTSIEEIRRLVEARRIDPATVAAAPALVTAFGRGQQYVCMIKAGAHQA